MHQGVICAEAIAGLQPEPLNSANIPNCTYSRPQVASIGITEAQAALQGRAVTVGRFPFLANGKAIAIGEASGFVKTILDRETGQLVGAHLIGPDVTELIAGLSLGQTAGLTQTQLTETIFPHPTLTESIHESVLASLGKALHI
jgi:dihydrolipoamide dehydrogenase